jgi:hypothetical protein
MIVPFRARGWISAEGVADPQSSVAKFGVHLSTGWSSLQMNVVILSGAKDLNATALPPRDSSLRSEGQLF